LEGGIFTGNFRLLEANMYPESLIIPMREQLARVGFKEARSAREVDAALALPGTTMLVVNAICDNAAARMRPGLRLALKNPANLPSRMITVFAGQDTEATQRARSYFNPHPPTSPAIAILRDGKPLYLMQRDQIEEFTPQQVADELTRAFAEFCANTTA
jgi:putative YphP/YqiW family bacilliredoxin